ncbi:plastocyanin/azurin family copper-binding protein [Natronomonas marina]|jgi:plastocyanin|uniref:plastocyanin/azurin family copper-binding protein n=1 Tax=Natronomonas marina TaxID=2961939 RepID=UPI0020C9EDA3|nr:plastocyanin/azurin family copper-binding protein [Natronomonas marina]
MERRRYLQLVAAAGGAVSIAGCTDDGGNGGGEPTDTATDTDEGMDTATDTDEGMDTATATETETPTETAEQTETPTETAEQTATPPSDPDQRVAVGANGLNFEPAGFEISVGDTVLWEWVGSGHNIAVESKPDGADWSGKAEEFSYGEGTVHAHTFEVAGEYDYVCEPHQSNGMTGSFTVSE